MDMARAEHAIHYEDLARVFGAPWPPQSSIVVDVPSDLVEVSSDVVDVPSDTSEERPAERAEPGR
eukprot:797450-Lingulodinium_polyedra.AAC.1